MIDTAPIMDPAGVLASLGAICGIVAALQWFGLARVTGDGAEGSARASARFLGRAAVLTGFALLLTGAGVLLGRFG